MSASEGFDVNRNADIGIVSLPGLARRLGVHRFTLNQRLARGTLRPADGMIGDCPVWIDDSSKAAARRRTALRRGDQQFGLMLVKDVAALMGVAIAPDRKTSAAHSQLNFVRVVRLFDKGLVPAPSGFVGGIWCWETSAVKRWIEERRRKLTKEMDALVAALA